MNLTSEQLYIHHCGLLPSALFVMVKEDERKERAEASKQARAVIDRIEDNGMAVLLIGEDGKTQVDIPVQLLPEGAKDGDHLRINMTIDSHSRAASEERIKKLQDQLRQQSGAEGKKDFKL